MMPPFNRLTPTGGAGEADDDRPEHNVTDEPPNDRGNGRQQLDQDLERFLEPAAANSET